MRKFMMLLPFAAVLTYCHSPKSAETGDPAASAAKRLNLPDNGGSGSPDSDMSDSIKVIGSQYVPIHVSDGSGTPIKLEGSWILESMNGTSIPGRSNINTGLINKNPPAGTEIRRDSVTTTTNANGVKETTTEVDIDRMGNPVKRITPPQGSNYHIPEKPKISFFGENKTFSGFTGCNKFSGRYKTAGDSVINLIGAAPSTKMVCIGDYDEEAFINTLHRVNRYRGMDGKLELLEGNNVILVFSKTDKK